MGNVGHQKIEKKYIKSLKKHIPIETLLLTCPTCPFL